MQEDWEGDPSEECDTRENRLAKYVEAIAPATRLPELLSAWYVNTFYAERAR